MGGRLDIVIERIRDLLALPSHGQGAPSRERIESVLTEGYAEALALDGERLRLERKIDQVTAHLARGGETRAEDLQKMMARVEATEEDLAELRKLLTALRSRVAQESPDGPRHPGVVAYTIPDRTA
jgi:tRNA C32,U32 (ribose-2'-O)-methylase TrmJ